MGNAIFRRRGDTYAEPVTITDKNGVPQDINGKAFVLTCSRVENPDDASAQLFQLVGNIVDGDNGQVEFPMTDDQADNLGEFFFDIEMSDSDGSNRRTVLKGPFVLGQDITKPISSFVYLPEAGVGSIAADKSEEWAGAYTTGADVIYGTRDAANVLAFQNMPTHTSVMRLAWSGQAAKRKLFPLNQKLSFEALFYIEEAVVSLEFGTIDRIFVAYAFLGQDAATGNVSCQVFSQNPDFEMIYEVGNFDATAAGWYRIKIEHDPAAPHWGVKVWTDGDAEPSGWTAESSTEVIGPHLEVSFSLRGSAISGAASPVVELGEWSWVVTS